MIKTKIQIKKIQKAIPYTNPGSRTSRLGNRIPAIYGVFRGDKLIAEIKNFGTAYWIVQTPKPEYKLLCTGYSLKDVKSKAITYFEKN